MNDTSDLRALPDDLSTRTLRDLPISVVLADPHRDDLPLVYVNDAFTRMTGYASAAVLGRNCRFLQGEDTEERNRERIRQAIDAREEVTVDILNYRADGTPFRNRLIIAPLLDESGELTYFLGIQTERDAVTGEVDRADILQEQLDELQHRVKNHLAMVISLIRVEARTGDPAKALAVLARRVETLSVLYSEFDRYGVPGEGARIALGAYVSRICAATQNLVSSAQVRLNTSVCQANMATDDAGRLGLFLSEVLNNALEHGFPDERRGSVSVVMECQPDRDRLRLVVADDGVGMAEGAWPRSGSLGGRIVENLVRRLGGELDVTTGEDGTRIVLTLPFTDFG